MIPDSREKYKELFGPFSGNSGDSLSRLPFGRRLKPLAKPKALPTEFLQSPTRALCAQWTHKEHTWSLRSVFRGVHAATENLI